MEYIGDKVHKTEDHRHLPRLRRPLTPRLESDSVALSSVPSRGTKKKSAARVVTVVAFASRKASLALLRHAGTRLVSKTGGGVNLTRAKSCRVSLTE